MADGESFPDRSVAAQARNSVYSRGYLRRRQVELTEGNVEPHFFLLRPQTHSAYDADDDDIFKVLNRSSCVELSLL